METHYWARRQVPKDHSCLFTSLIFLLQGPESLKATQNILESVTKLRKFCADEVLVNSPEIWPEWKLGREPSRYANWIQKQDTWGGEIELVILSAKFAVEVVVVNMTTDGKQVTSYGVDTATKGRVFLLYTGQHYDPIVCVITKKAAVKENCEANKTHSSSVSETRILPLSTAIDKAGLASLAKDTHAKEKRKKRQRVLKKIKCIDCGAVLDNASAFQDHCMDADVEHSEEFAYECEEVTIVVDEEELRNAAKVASGYDLEHEHTFTYYDIPEVALSNFFPSIIDIDGTTYSSVEHFRQYKRFALNSEAGQAAADIAAKILNTRDLTALSVLVSGQNKLQMPQWEEGTKEKITRIGMAAKFSQHSNLSEQLLALAGKTIVCVGDNLWGSITMRSGMPEGKNNFGIILMNIRDEILNK